MSANTNSAPSNRDPSTFLQRPTSAKTPDVSHILTSLFGEVYTKDIISTDVIKNLTISSDVDNEYHKRYVERLKQAQIIKENRIQEYAMLEKHILEARAKALAFEERELEKRKKLAQNPDAFGVPPVKSYFSYCLDDTLLKEHGLLVPSDYYFQIKQPIVPMPKSDSPDRHLKDTYSSKQRSQVISPKVLPPIGSSRINMDDIEELHKAGSELGDYEQQEEYELDEDNDEEKTDPFWKKTLRQEERMIDKTRLKRLEDRINFLPNPRLDAERVGKISDNIPIVFEATPKYILFNKYITGKVYESSFEIRNISLVAHQMRALPPKTQYFSLSLGQYPQGQSVIAPGLGAIFNIRFAPDSLGTFEDEIVVECSNGSKLIIPIIAKRESPSLSIGSVINCGQALVGQIKVCRFVIKNKGGDGRFVIFPKSSWPVSTFKTNLSTSVLNLYPFEIQPSIFELHKGDVFILEVIFKPPDTKKYEQDIIITCDNCTTIEFKLVGEGELAEVEYVQQDDDLSQQLKENILPIDDFKDRLSTRIIRFPPLNPNVFTRKRFAIKNKSLSSIDYSWVIYKPVFDETISNTDFVNKNVNYVIDKDSLFTVAPKQGTLDRSELKTFELMFSPTRVGSYCSVAHLILHNIPEINKQLMIEPGIHKTTLTKEDANTCDFVANVVELRGECEPFQFTLDPPAIFVPGATYMHSTTRKSFRLINMSICPISFNWKQVLDSSVIQVEPSYGEIASKSYALMDVLITGTKPGKIVDDIPCFVEYADEPIYLHVEADIKGPEATIQEAGVDFGLVQVGNVSKTHVTVQNISNLQLNWKLSCLENQELFGFDTHGSLQPLESRKLNIIFAPNDEIIVNTQFKLEIEDGNELFFNCFAQSQRPSASFMKSQLVLDELYLNVIHNTKAILCNHSVLEAEFRLGQTEGEDSKFVELSIEPQFGIMKSKSLLELEIKIISSRIGDISDLRIPCYISEMNEPVFLNIIGKVHGVSVNFFMSNEPEFDHRASSNKLNENSSIEFDPVEVGNCSIKYLFIKNTSGIDTKVRLNVKRFQTIESTNKDSNLFADPLKKPKKFGESFKLKDGKNGIGFGVEKELTNLPAFGTTCIALAAVAELWGRYSDKLKIKVDGIESETQFKMSIDVNGSPIKLYAGKVAENESEQISMIRFGSQIQGTGLIPRKLKLQNTCSLPIEINWKIFLEDANDDRLIDLNLIYQDVDESSMIIASNPANSNKNLPQKSSNSNATSYDDYYDNEYVYFERVPIVKINLTKHFGRELVDQDNEIYLMSNRKNFLKPRETIHVDVIFNSDISLCGLYDAIFVGYLSLAPELLKGEGFDRKIGFDKEPIKFKATGKLDSPNLVVELDENLHYDVALGDLINKERNGLIKEITLSNKFSLLNSTFSPIELDLETKEPFYLGNFSTKTQRYLLKPKGKLKVDLLFKFDKNYADMLDLSRSNPLLINEYLTINYSKGLHQIVPFTAKIFAPEIVSTCKHINYETCLVGQERCQQFAIRNPSSSSLLWRLDILNNDFDVFRCDITNGFLEGSKIFVNKTEQIINVYFTAKHDEQYESRIKFTIEPFYGAPSLVIDLKGNGSYDQKYEAFYNI